MTFTLLQLRKIANQRQLIGLLLLCWILVGTASFIHAQNHYVSSIYDKEHTATQNFECQLCAGSFQLTPFITLFIFTLSASKYHAVRHVIKQYFYQSFALHYIGNRDPPGFTVV